MLSNPPKICQSPRLRWGLVPIPANVYESNAIGKSLTSCLVSGVPPLFGHAGTLFALMSVNPRSHPHFLARRCANTLAQKGRGPLARERSVPRGAALAAATGGIAKHAIKRVDRFVGNARLDLERAQGDRIRHVLRGRRQVLLALDWTDAQRRASNPGLRGPDAGPHHSLGLADGPERSAPRPATRIRVGAVPPGCHVVLVADRGLSPRR